MNGTMRLAPLLLIIGIVAFGAFASAEQLAQSSQTSSFRAASSHSGNKTTATVTENTDVTDRKSEERGVFSVINKLLGKDSGISKKFAGMKNNPDVAAALSNPVVNKLGTAIEKNPSILTRLAENPSALNKLAKDPQVAKAAKVLEKNHVSFTAKDVNALRAVAAKDPNKAGIVFKIVNFFQGLSLAGGVALLIGLIIFSPIALGLGLMAKNS